MSKNNYPIYDISDLQTGKFPDDTLTVSRFAYYLSNNPHLHKMHRHTFYHLVYFTKGSGSQIIDFVHFPVEPGLIYFMDPSQVHKWIFIEPVEGFIINFSPTFFEHLKINSQLLQYFSFYKNNPQLQVIQLKQAAQEAIAPLFEDMLIEQAKKLPAASLMIATQILQLFIIVQRQVIVESKNPLTNNPQSATIQEFKNLLEIHFKNVKLPSDYATMLFITPNHLNALCKKILGITAGNLIRDRIILEAKRLLVNDNETISEIANTLNFLDNSYFTKFFKKHTGKTPEVFRAEEIVN